MVLLQPASADSSSGGGVNGSLQCLPSVVALYGARKYLMSNRGCRLNVRRGRRQEGGGGGEREGHCVGVGGCHVDGPQQGRGRLLQDEFLRQLALELMWIWRGASRPFSGSL